uniref:TonB-dependent receptor n=1 Tax=Croceicoccus bisphenolivorans TaxID=1783232 RepID=UPI00083794C2
AQGGTATALTVNPNPTDVKFIGALDPRLDTGLAPGFVPGIGPVPNACFGAGVPDNPDGTSLLVCPPYEKPFYENYQWSVNAQLDVDLGFATLTVLPAYRFEDLDYLEYGPGYADKQHPKSKQKSIEARLSDRSANLKWVLGAYYFKVDQTLPTQIRNETNFQNGVVDLAAEVESYAFFGETTYSLTDNLRIIGGLRYTHEQSGTSGDLNSVIGPPGVINPITMLENVQTEAYNPFHPILNPTGELLDYPIANETSSSAVTWKAGLEFDVTRSSLLFGTVSRGFKGGGTYVDRPGVDSSFKPEFLTALEIGSRNRFLDNRLQINVEAFYWKLSDQQIPYVGFNDFGNVTFKTANAGKANMYGADLDMVFRLTSNDTLRGSVEYLHSEYDTFVRAVPSFSVLPGTGCVATDNGEILGTPSSLLDCSGQQLLRAPKWSGSAGYEHRFDLASGAFVAANFDMTFASKRYVSPSYTANVLQPANTVLNAALTYESANGAIVVSGWIRNIANERILAGGEQFVPGYARLNVQPPRTYGGSVRFNF